MDKYEDFLEKRGNELSKSDDDSDNIRDAINRDMRRHPGKWKQDRYGKFHRESGIFESVSFINE